MEASEVNIIVTAHGTWLSANNGTTAITATLMMAAIHLSFCQRLFMEHLLCAPSSRH